MVIAASTSMAEPENTTVKGDRRNTGLVTKAEIEMAIRGGNSGRALYLMQTTGSITDSDGQQISLVALVPVTVDPVTATRIADAAAQKK